MNIRLVLFCLPVAVLPAVATAADVIEYHGYTSAIELKNQHVRVVLCPEVGGRILEYSLNGKNVLYLSPEEKAWQPGDRPQSSAGRFDIGPELVIPRHPLLWSGQWQGEVTGPLSARLTSQKDAATGVQLVREFVLAPDSSHLQCTQTIRNVSSRVTEWCHWSRTFVVGQGICIIPLTDPQTGPMSRFPNGYVMYENGTIINMKPEDPRIIQRDRTLLISPTPKKPKLGFDSYAGVLAYLAPQNQLFVKRFTVYPNRVYNEAAGLTISVWYPDRAMVELEPIGPRERLKPGESAAFTEHWYLAEFPYPEENANVDLSEILPVIEKLSK